MTRCVPLSPALPAVKDAIDELEESYTWHVRTQRCLGCIQDGSCGAVGALSLASAAHHNPTWMAAIGSAALTTLSYAATACSLGPSWRREAQRLSPSAASQKDVADFPVDPETLLSEQRLRFTVRWGQRQLQERAATTTKRMAIIDVVLSAFAPWVTVVQSFGNSHGSGRWACLSTSSIEQTTVSQYRQGLRHLLPLQDFLQRQECAKAVMESVEMTRQALLKADKASFELAILMQRCRVCFCAALEAATRLSDAPAEARRQHELNLDVLRSLHGILALPLVQRSLNEASDGSFHSLSDSEDGSASGDSRTQRSAAPYLDRAKAFPRGDDNHMWNDFPTSHFNLRSASYHSDKRKEQAGAPLLDMVNVDFHFIGEKGPVLQAADHPDFCPAHQRQMGDQRFFFIVNFIVRPYQAVMTSALDPEAAWLKADTPQSRLWTRFLEMSPKEREDVFKVIGFVYDGPWFVRKLTPKKPVLIGRRVSMTSHHAVGNHIEIVFDIVGSKKEEMIVSTVLGYLSHLQFVFLAVLEGREEDELPESPLFCQSFKGVDVKKVSVPICNP
mmetsp:Transcript_41409/g.75018  ORF Transcript_41409/g.75018 Transcript_41409/m.75018 type:complete len:559 (-) Transcript_41409:28-1704(-)